MAKSKEEVGISLDALKKNLHWLALALILIFGFYLRVYHLDYPVVGYHNWKETHYLTEAKNFERYGDWLTPKVDFPDIYTNPEGAHGDTLPLDQWVAALGFMIFGEQLWVARFVSVIFVMGSILFLYLVIKKLFGREDLALTAALVAATNPLLVFFGRQVQVDNAALFFGMLSIWLYLLWLDSPEQKPKAKYLALASLAFAVSFLTKYSFALLAIPMLALFPYRKLMDKAHLKNNLKTYIYAMLPLALVILWIINNKIIDSKYITTKNTEAGFMGDIYYNFSALFGSKFWDVMKPYAADNYTLIGMFFAALGLILFFAMYKENRGNRFLLAYIVGSIPWLWIMASKLSGHSYHQYPIAPLMIILVSFCFVVIASNLEKIVKIGQIRWLLIAVLFLLLVYPPFFKFGGGIFEAKNRQFDTQFYGLDIAGDYIKKHSKPDERIFFSGHQSYGVLWHADRKGSSGHYNETVTMYFEETQNFRWIFVYQWGLGILKEPDKWDYIKDNYSLKQIAFQQTQQGPSVIYMLFEKGGTFNETLLNEVLQKKQQAGQYGTRDYELTGGKAQIIYFDV